MTTGRRAGFGSDTGYVYDNMTGAQHAMRCALKVNFTIACRAAEEARTTTRTSCSSIAAAIVTFTPIQARAANGDCSTEAGRRDEWKH